VWQTAAAQIIVNAMCSYPGMNQALMNPTPIRWTNALYTSDLYGVQEYNNLKLRLTTGIPFGNAPEDVIAGKLNDVYFMMNILLAVPSIVGSLSSTGTEAILTIFDLFQSNFDAIFTGEPNYESILDAIVSFG